MNFLAVEERSHMADLAEQLDLLKAQLCSLRKEMIDSEMDQKERMEISEGHHGLVHAWNTEVYGLKEASTNEHASTLLRQDRLRQMIVLSKREMEFSRSVWQEEILPAKKRVRAEVGVW